MKPNQRDAKMCKIHNLCKCSTADDIYFRGFHIRIGDSSKMNVF